MRAKATLVLLGGAILLATAGGSAGGGFGPGRSGAAPAVDVEPHAIVASGADQTLRLVVRAPAAAAGLLVLTLPAGFAVMPGTRPPSVQLSSWGRCRQPHLGAAAGVQLELRLRLDCPAGSEVVVTLRRVRVSAAAGAASFPVSFRGHALGAQPSAVVAAPPPPPAPAPAPPLPPASPGPGAPSPAAPSGGGSGGSGGGSGGSGAPAPLTTPTPTSAPTSVSVSLAASGAVTQTVGHAGGTLQTTGPDGTVYALAVPANAVSDGTHITMTPLAGITGAPAYASTIAGVQFEPSGLALMAPATLTITPSAAVPAAHLVGFDYQGTGSDFQYQPAVAGAGGTIEVTVTHFSGAGAGDNHGAPAPATPPAGGGEDAQWQYAIYAAFVDKENGDSTAETRLAGLFDSWWNYIQQTEVPPGRQDDDAAAKAIRSMLTWAREKELLGYGDQLGTVTPVAINVIQHALDRHEHLCAEKPDLTEIPTIIGLQRQGLLLNGGDESAFPIEDAFHCASFRVEFDSLFLTRYDNAADPAGGVDNGTVTVDLKAKITDVRPDPTTGYLVIHGTDRSTYSQATGSVSFQTPQCPGTLTYLSGVGDTFDALKLVLDPQGQSILLVDLHAPSEHVTQNDCGGPHNADLATWLTDFGLLHRSELDNASTPSIFDLPLTLTGEGGDGLVAAASYDRTFPAGPGLTIQELTTVSIYHTPPPWTRPAPTP